MFLHGSNMIVTISITVDEKDVSRIDLIRNFYGIPSRSEAIRRIVEREAEKINGYENPGF